MDQLQGCRFRQGLLRRPGGRLAHAAPGHRAHPDRAVRLRGRLRRRARRRGEGTPRATRRPGCPARPRTDAPPPGEACAGVPRARPARRTPPADPGADLGPLGLAGSERASLIRFEGALASSSGMLGQGRETGSRVGGRFWRDVIRAPFPPPKADQDPSISGFCERELRWRRLPQEVVEVETLGDHGEVSIGSGRPAFLGRSQYSSRPFWSGSRRYKASLTP